METAWRNAGPFLLEEVYCRLNLKQKDGMIN